MTLHDPSVIWILELSEVACKDLVRIWQDQEQVSTQFSSSPLIEDYHTTNLSMSAHNVAISPVFGRLALTGASHSLGQKVNKCQCILSKLYQNWNCGVCWPHCSRIRWLSVFLFGVFLTPFPPTPDLFKKKNLPLTTTTNHYHNLGVNIYYQTNFCSNPTIFNFTIHFTTYFTTNFTTNVTTNYYHKSLP